MNSVATFRGTLLPPLLIGLGYAAAQAIGRGTGWEWLYWQSPFMFWFLSGLIMALAMRPVIARIPWRRDTAFGVAAAMLLGMGPVAEWCAARLLEIAGAKGSAALVPPNVVPELLGLFMAAGLMGGLFRPRGGEIGWAGLRVRLKRHTPAGWALRLGGLALAALGAGIVIGAVAVWSADALLVPPLLDINPWALLAKPNGDAAAPMQILAIGWLRALALVAPLVPVALVLRGTRLQVTLVFALLLFVIGDFAPMIEDQPFPSPLWLTARVALDALKAGLIGWCAAHLIGQIRKIDISAAGPPG